MYPTPPATSASVPTGGGGAAVHREGAREEEKLLDIETWRRYAPSRNRCRGGRGRKGTWAVPQECL
jgi:hypothetical protein